MMKEVVGAESLGNLWCPRPSACGGCNTASRLQPVVGGCNAAFCNARWPVRAGRDSIQFKSFNSNSNHQRPKHSLTNGRYTATHSVSYELDQTNLDELVGFDDGGDPVHKVNRFVLVSGSCTGSGNCGRDKIYKILDPLGGDQSKNHCE